VKRTILIRLSCNKPDLQVTPCKKLEHYGEVKNDVYSKQQTAKK